MVGALDNIRVIDFGHYVAGPLTGMLLADQGADVIKVDPPGGPSFDHPANATWNRGKRSISLDLKDPDDLATARSLIATADVVIENFRPGVMDRLGLGDDEVRSENRRLIYVSLPGYGPEDPRTDVQAWEGVIMAGVDVFRPMVEFGDMLRQLHKRPSERDGDPVFTSESMASGYAALVASIGIGAALHVRHETGSGQRVVVPLFDAMLQGIGIFGMSRLPFKPAGRPLVNGWNHQYQCADGRWIHLACHQPWHAKALAHLIDRADLIERGFTNRSYPHQSMYYELTDALEGVFLEQPADEWQAKLNQAGLPGAVCQSSAQWLDHPQAIEGGLLVEIDDPAVGPTRQPGPLVCLSSSGIDAVSPAPKPDQDRIEILDEVERGTGQLTGWAGLIRPTKGPLSGLKVLDLSIILSGPSCGRTLAEFGAEVIKVDDPKRTVQYYGDINRGKRSILLDLTTEEGMEVFRTLALSADVILHNFRNGVVERLGIDYDSIREINPNVIYAGINAYGDRGPWSDMPGYDETVEALTGMQFRYGGPNNPAVWPYGVMNDYGTGYATAFGILLAVHHRNGTGEGQAVHASLARTAGILQSMHLLDHPDQDWSEPAGPDALGFRAHQGLYECADGWIYVGASDAEQLSAVVGDVVALEDQLVTWCEERSAAEAVQQLVEAGIGADELRWINDVMSDPAVVRRGLSVVAQGPGDGLVRTTGPARWLSHSWIDAGHPAPEPGTDALAVLTAVGRQDRFEELLDAAVIRVPGSAKG